MQPEMQLCALAGQPGTGDVCGDVWTCEAEGTGAQLAFHVVRAENLEYKRKLTPKLLHMLLGTQH